MIKKYGFTIFFCFLFMLCGITLSSSQLTNSANTSKTEITSDAFFRAFKPNITFRFYGSLNQVGVQYAFRFYATEFMNASNMVDVGTLMGMTNNTSVSNGIYTYTIPGHLGGGMVNWRHVQLEFEGINTATFNSGIHNIVHMTVTNLPSGASVIGPGGAGNYNWVQDVIRWSDTDSYATDIKYLTATINIYYNIQIYLSASGANNNYSTSMTYDTYSNTRSNITLPTRAGYNFKGYYTSANGGNQVIDGNGNMTSYWSISNPPRANANQTLYAQWEQQGYRVDINTYYPNSTAQNAAYFTLTRSNGTSYRARDNIDELFTKGTSFTISNIEPVQGYYIKEVYFTINYGNGYEEITNPNELSRYFTKNDDDTYTVTINFDFSPQQYDYWDTQVIIQTGYVRQVTVEAGYSGGSNVQYGNAQDGFVVLNPSRTGYSVTSWTASNGTLIDPSFCAQSTTFNGSNSYVSAGGRTYMYTDAITVNLWANIQYNVNDFTTNEYRPLISCTESGGWALGLYGDGRLYLEMWDADAGGYKRIVTSSGYWGDLTNAWHQYTFTFDGHYAT